MKDLIESARELQEILERLELPFCFIGGLANLQWGEPRLTQDLDLTVFAGWGDEERIIDLILENTSARFEDARQFAITNRVLLLETGDGILMRQQDQLDTSYVIEQIRILDQAKQGEGIADRLEGLLQL